MIFSIHSRILISALIVLALSMGLIGIILDKAFRNNVEHSQRENLRTQIYSLLAAADVDEKGTLQLPSEVTEPRLNLAESSLHARIITIDERSVWQSKSMLNSNIPFSSKIKMAKFIFTNQQHNNNYYTSVNFTTIWVTDTGEYAYVFQVAENKSVFSKQIRLFRENLYTWLVGVSLILIIIQTLILRWGLKPLRQVAEDLVNIEKGSVDKLDGKYPNEITPLTNNLNKLLASSQLQLTKYRDALGNMAHSIKTPIAVLHGIINSSTNNEKAIALEQLNLINNIVEYQLNRAATVGHTNISHKVLLLPIAEKITSNLQKMYIDKNIILRVNIDNNVLINVDEGDLYELLGNLLENSFKWCANNVSISANHVNNKVQIAIEDDGPGINDDEKERILLRGQRADQSTPGHGLGLAMVNDVLLAYQGEMVILKSELSGAKIIINI